MNFSGIDAAMEAIERKDPAIMWVLGWSERFAKELAQQRPIVTAARAFVEWHQKGQPGTPGTLYPFTYAQLDAWHDEREKRLSALISAVAGLDTETEENVGT